MAEKPKARYTIRLVSVKNSLGFHKKHKGIFFNNNIFYAYTKNINLNLAKKAENLILLYSDEFYNIIIYFF